MKQKRSLIIAVFIAVLLIGLLVWRLWPRSLESLCGLDFDQATSLDVSTQTTDFEAGSPVFVRHHIDGEDTLPGTEHFDPLLDLFRNIEARPSLTNLLRPWAISGFSWSGSVDFLYGVVACGSDGNMFTLTNRGELTVGQHLYYITDEEQFNALWEYVTTHGTENIS